MRIMGTIGKGLSFVLVLATVLQLSVSSFAGTVKSDKASTIRLKKTEGTVTVENSSKDEIVQTPDMRLNDGDHELTDITSYAWMNLDDSKLIKLDEESESEVRKKGKKLEVLLDSGSLFFNVTEPLKDDETFNIRTSTMVAGIRGTCGWVRILDGLTTRVYLLEGRLECVVVNPVTGSKEKITLKGGQYADFCVFDPNSPGKKCDILTENFTREDIEPYVLVELVGDDTVIDKIYKDSGIDLRDLTREEALKKLTEAQKYSAEKKAERESSASKTAEKAENYFGDGLSVNDSVVYLTMPQTATTVQKYLNNGEVKKVVLLPGDGDNTLWVDIDFCVPAEKTLEASSEVPVNVIKDHSMTIDGTADLGDNLGNSGSITVNSSNTLRVVGLFTNSGYLNNTETGRIVLVAGIYSSGDIVTSGRIEAEAGVKISQLITLAGGTFTVSGGSIEADNCDTIVKLTQGSNVVISLSGGVISNDRIGGETFNVKEGSFKLESLGTDIKGVTDSLLGTDVSYEDYGSGSVWRTDGKYHLVLLEQVESYPVVITGNIEHGRLTVPSRVEVGARVPIGVIPDEGYELDYITVTQGGRKVGVSADHSFVMPNGNVQIGGRFKQKDIKEEEKKEENNKEENKNSDNTASQSGSSQAGGASSGSSGNSSAGENPASQTGQEATPKEKRAITISNSISMGTVVADVSTAESSARVTLTLTPDAGHRYKQGTLKVTATDGSSVAVTSIGNGKYTFTMPEKAVYVHTQFEYDGTYNLAATWCKDNGDVKFRIGNEYVTCANPGDVVIMETTPLSGYGPSLSPTDNYNTKLGPAVTVFWNATEDVWYFDMPSRNVTDLDVIFTNDGTDSYQISENYLPAGTNYSLSLRASAQQNTVPADHYSPGSKISIDVPMTQDVKNLSVTSGGNAVRVYETGGRKYFYMPRGNVTVSATFEPKTYSITYDLNAGGDPTARINGTIPTTGTYGTAVTLPTNVTRDGYLFAGWYEVASPGSINSRVLATSAEEIYDTTYYAVWRVAAILTMPQEPSDIQDKLDDSSVSEVVLAPGSASNTFTLGEQITIPAGKTLTISEGVTVIVNEDGSILNLSGNTLNNSGILYIGRENGIVNGDEDNPGRIVNDGYIFLNSSRAIDTSYGNIVNNRTIYYKTGSTIKYSNNNGSAPEDGIQVLDMGLAGDAIYIRTRIDQTSNYKLDFFGNGEIGNHDDEYHNAAYINGNEKTSITELEIHEGITKVGNNAFNIHLTGNNEYYGFTSVILPDTLKQIGNYAFYNLIRPETITIPDSVTTIGNFAFARQQDKEDHTTAITLPASLESLGKYAFGYRNVITSIEIPGSVDIISEGAFKGCTLLTTATLNEGVKEVGKEAFSGCTSLEAINLPNGLETIREKAYFGCTGVSNLVSLPNSVTTIEYDAFTGVPSIHYANQSLPESLTSFDLYFYKGTVLDEIVIPEGVTALSGRLRDMNNLEKVTVGPNITTVNNRPFDELSGCSGFNTIVFNGTMELWNSDTYRFFRPEQINPNNIYDGYYNRILMTNHVKVICTDGEIQY